METSLQLNSGEKLMLECRPLDKLVYYSTFKTAIPFFIVAVFMSFIFTDAHDPQQDKIKFFIVVGFLLLVCFFYAMNTMRLAQFRYIFTDQRCIIYSGFIGINKQVIPYNRIADVEIRQGTIEALMGLSSVYVDEQAMNYSAGALIRGLDMDTAEKITKIVSEHITKKQI